MTAMQDGAKYAGIPKTLDARQAKCLGLEGI